MSEWLLDFSLGLMLVAQTVWIELTSPTRDEYRRRLANLERQYFRESDFK